MNITEIDIYDFCYVPVISTNAITFITGLILGILIFKNILV